VTTEDGSEKANSWHRLGRELRERTKKPCSHVSFVLYFLVAVVIIGGAGVILEGHSVLFHEATPKNPQPNYGGLRVALITFFPALAGSSCMQLIWAENENKALRAFAIFMLTVLTIFALVVSPSRVPDAVAFWVSSISAIVALWTWWIANARQLDFLDPDVTVGGKDISADLPGSLDGFTV
jgi:hypothetical protein